MAQGVVTVLLGAAFWLAGRPDDSLAPRPAWWAAGALALAMVMTLSLSSHAMGVERARPLFVTADALHALTAGTWMGTLAVILGVGRATATDDVGIFAPQIRSFSPMALTSGITLVAMGTLLAWTHVQTFANLFETRYGRLLIAKILVAGGVFAAGFWNWRRGLSSSDHPAGAAALRALAAAEVFFAVGVLLLTAVLVHSPKPGD
jgi:copper transport protein